MGDDDLRKLLQQAGHELRTPLVSLRGFLELAELRAGELPPPLPEWLTTMSRSARRLQVQLDRLMLVARPLDRLRGQPRAADAELRQALRRAPLVAPVAAATLTTSPFPASTIQPAVVAELVLILVENAVEHGYAGGPGAIRVLAAPRADGGLTLRVEDDGIGLSAERAAALGALNDTAPGLGWRVLRAVVERLGGRAVAEPGDPGLHVVVELPGT